MDCFLHVSWGHLIKPLLTNWLLCLMNPGLILCPWGSHPNFTRFVTFKVKLVVSNRKQFYLDPNYIFCVYFFFPNPFIKILRLCAAVLSLFVLMFYKSSFLEHSQDWERAGHGRQPSGSRQDPRAIGASHQSGLRSKAGRKNSQRPQGHTRSSTGKGSPLMLLA